VTKRPNEISKRSTLVSCSRITGLAHQLSNSNNISIVSNTIPMTLEEVVVALVR
jgi:hypothetical protein